MNTDRPPRSGSRNLLWLVLIVIAFAAGWYFRAPLHRGGHGHSAGGPATAPSAANAGQKQLWTCGMHPQVIQDHPGECPICHMELTPLNASAVSAGQLTIDPTVVQNMGLRYARVETGAIARQVRVVAYLEEPEPAHRDINLRVDGWIEKLYANIDGMDVKEGQPLFDLYSPELRGAIEELITARRMAAAGQGNAAAIRSGVERKLELMGLSRAQVQEMAALEEAPAAVPILAPMTGHLTQKMVYEGAAVKAGELAMRLASRSRMWLDTQVYESQLPLIRVGDGATATVEALPGRTFAGQIVFIHPHLDPETRTALVRIELDNPDLALRQGMYATATVDASVGDDSQVIVPREAIIDTGSRQLVFVSLGEGRFEPRTIKSGISGAGVVQVLEGLRAGETVVTSGQFLLDSESRLKEAIQKHLHGTTPEGGGAVATAGQVEPAGSAAPAAPAPSTQPSVAAPGVDDILAAYLPIARKLGEKQAEDKPVDLSGVVKAARAAVAEADGPAKQLLQPVLASAEAMADLPIGEQRKAFLPLSEALLHLLDRTPPSPSRPKLHLAQCPMALDSRGAIWIQDSDDLANPYFATSMKSCGEFVRDLP